MQSSNRLAVDGLRVLIVSATRVLACSKFIMVRSPIKRGWTRRDEVTEPSRY